MNLTYSFGDWIAQRRKRLDLTQRDLAERVSCGLATVKKIEADERRPSRDLAALLADALGIPAQRQATFIECARGLRAVDALVDVEIDNRGQGGLPRPRSSPAIPIQSTRFVGRQAELTQIENYLKDPACRLLTLVGPGGIGKTRLAYEAAGNSAERFTSGVYGISMAGIEQSDLLTAAIGQRLEAPSSGGGDSTQQLLDYLRDRNLLLVLDNLEHLLNGAGVLADVLAEAPAVRILATSRERLNLKAEWLLPIDGLAYPGSDVHLDASASAAYPAIQLFEQSAQRVLPGYQATADLPAIARICQLVEGMPLAIELAANWVRRMRPAQIADQIEHDAGFLAAGWRDTPDRHRSIGALFDYSWQTLSAPEQTAFVQLSVFRNGFDAAAAEGVAGASWQALTALEDKSLVRANPSGRYDMHELIRQYAGKRLVELAHVDEVCRQHAGYYMDLAEVAASKIRGPDQVTWFPRVDAELDNLRAALDWAFAHQEVEIGLRICISLRWYWYRRGLIQEAFRWFSRGLALSEGWRTPLRAEALGFGASAAALAHQPIFAEYAKQALALAAELDLPASLAVARLHMTHVMPDYNQVAPIVEANLAILREHGNRWDLAVHLANAGGRARDQGDFARADRMFSECLALASEIGAVDTIATAYGQQGRLAIYRQDYAAAQESLETALRLSRELGNRLGVADWLMPLGRVLMYQRSYEEATRHLEEALDLWRDMGDQIGVADALGFLAALSAVRQDYVMATPQLQESFSITVNMPIEAYVSRMQGVINRLIVTAGVALRNGQPETAARLLSASETLRMRANYALEPAPLAEYDSEVNNLRSLLGETAFGETWAAGGRMNAADATRFALTFLGSVLHRLAKVGEL